MGIRLWLFMAVILSCWNSIGWAGDIEAASVLDKILEPAAATPVVLESTSVIRDAQGKRNAASSGTVPVSLQLSRFKVADGVEDIRVSPNGNIIVKSTAALAIYSPDGKKLKILEGNAIYLSDNSKYFAVVNFIRAPRNSKKVRPCYVRLHDENGTLLWEKESQNLLFVHLSGKGHVALFPRIENSASANIFDANGAVITPANVFSNGNSYDLTFSDSAHSYLLRKTIIERPSGNGNAYRYYSSMHVFSINGVELFATKPVKEDSPAVVTVKAVNDSEAFVFSETIFGQNSSNYTYVDVGDKSFRKMEGFDGYFLQYAKHLGNNRLAVFTRDSFIIWDLFKNLPLSEYLLFTSTKNRGRLDAVVMIESVTYMNGRFIALAMAPRRQDSNEGNGLILIFDSEGRKIQEKSFPIGTFMVFTRVSSLGNRLIFSAGQNTLHSLRIE